MASVDSPGHDPSFLLQARALILLPVPHDVEHRVQGPHACHLLGSSGIKTIRRREKRKNEIRKEKMKMYMNVANCHNFGLSKIGSALKLLRSRGGGR